MQTNPRKDFQLLLSFFYKSAERSRFWVKFGGFTHNHYNKFAPEGGGNFSWKVEPRLKAQFIGTKILIKYLYCKTNAAERSWASRSETSLYRFIFIIDFLYCLNPWTETEIERCKRILSTGRTGENLRKNGSLWVEGHKIMFINLLLLLLMTFGCKEG